MIDSVISKKRAHWLRQMPRLWLRAGRPGSSASEVDNRRMSLFNSLHQCGLCLLVASLSMGVHTSLTGATADTPSCPPQPPFPDRELMLNAQRQATDRGFLWRISRDGRDSYLYGTIHAGRPEWFALGPKLEASLIRSGVLALEIDATDPAVLIELRRVSSDAPRSLPAD